LILALHLIDKSYRVFQKATATRALVLERKLNIELSETIAERHRSERLEYYVSAIYILFVLSVVLLARFSINMQEVGLVVPLGLGLLALLVIAICTGITFGFNLAYKYGYSEDWTISPLECSTKGTIEFKVTLSNLGKPVRAKRAKELLKKLGELRGDEELLNRLEEGEGLLERLQGKSYSQKTIMPEPIHFEDGKLLLEIVNEEIGFSKSKSVEGNIDVYDNHTWILKKEDFSKDGEPVKPGAYRLRPRGWPLPLHREIIVWDNSESP
jgi:hypothetical protein